MRWHTFGSESQYCDHLLPIYLEMKDEFRGKAFYRTSLEIQHPFVKLPISGREFNVSVNLPPKKDFWIVSSWQDVGFLYNAGIRNIVLIEHGIGQTYKDFDHPSFISSLRSPYVKRLWMPNKIAVEKQSKLLGNPVDQIYSHRVAKLRGIKKNKKKVKPSVVISFHSLLKGCPEQHSTHEEWLRNGCLNAIVERNDITVYGHSHPRSKGVMRPIWCSLNVPILETFDDVVKEADAYICDNSSSIFEAAACQIPVILLNGSRYRMSVHHGLRFWEFSDIGLNVNARSELTVKKFQSAIDTTLETDPYKDRRRQVCQILFKGGKSVNQLIEEAMKNE